MAPFVASNGVCASYLYCSSVKLILLDVFFIISQYFLDYQHNLKCIIRYNIVCFRKYIGQIYTDSLVHDKKALKLLVDTIGQVKSSVTFWL